MYKTGYLGNKLFYCRKIRKNANDLRHIYRKIQRDLEPHFMFNKNWLHDHNKQFFVTHTKKAGFPSIRQNIIFLNELKLDQSQMAARLPCY